MPSLYLETLGELGAVGLGLLVLVLAVPLVAVVGAAVPARLGRVRRVRRVPLPCGRRLGLGDDGHHDRRLFCGIAIIVEARRREEEDRARSSTGLRIAVLGGVAVLAAFSFVGLIGNVAASRSEGLSTTSATARPSTRRAGEVLGPVVRGPVAAPRRDPAHRRRLQARAGQPSEGGLEGSQNWISLSLALASEGKARRQALAEAERLNPLSDEVKQIKDSLK